MHSKAKEWDDKNKQALTGEVPKNRPCDWCGKAVKRGYIHKECIEKERDHWYSILY